MEEQQNNNLSVEILNGNTELVTGLVGNAHTLKEPGTKDKLVIPVDYTLQLKSLLSNILQQFMFVLFQKPTALRTCKLKKDSEVSETTTVFINSSSLGLF